MAKTLEVYGTLWNLDALKKETAEGFKAWIEPKIGKQYSKKIDIARLWNTLEKEMIKEGLKEKAPSKSFEFRSTKKKKSKR